MLSFDELIERKLIVPNNYLIKYQSLILKNKNTQRKAFETQIHHIIPKSAFKLLNEEVDESFNNKVNLCYKDHILAHYYLANCSKGMFKYSNIMALKHIVGNKYCSITEEDLLLELPGLQQLYEEAMKKQADRTKKIKTGIKFTPEHIQKMSLANKGRIHIHNDQCEKIIKPEEFDHYSSLGYVKGRLRKPSLETRALMSQRMKGIKKCTEHTRELLSKKVKGSR